MLSLASILAGWPLLLLALPAAASGLFVATSKARQVLGRLEALQSSLAGIARDTAVLPRLQAEVTALQHHLAALEKASRTREGRILRIADSVAALRASLPPR